MSELLLTFGQSNRSQIELGLFRLSDLKPFILNYVSIIQVGYFYGFTVTLFLYVTDSNKFLHWSVSTLRLDVLQQVQFGFIDGLH
jgi:hypothetical protein